MRMCWGATNSARAWYVAGRTIAFPIGIAAIIEPVKVYFRWRLQMREVDDQMMLDAALNGRADVIVTHNLRNFLPAASRFSSRDVGPASFAREVLK